MMSPIPNPLRRLFNRNKLWNRRVADRLLLTGFAVFLAFVAWLVFSPNALGQFANSDNVCQDYAPRNATPMEVLTV